MGDRNGVLAGKFATSVWQRGIEPRMYSRSLMSGAPIRPAEVRTGGVLSRTGENRWLNLCKNPSPGAGAPRFDYELLRRELETFRVFPSSGVM